MTGKQDVTGIVRQILGHRARERLIGLRRRKIKVYPGLKNHYWVNRWEIKVQLAYAVRGNPFDMVDPILDAVDEWDTRWAKERAKNVVVLKSEIMRMMVYLERAMTPEEYTDFVVKLFPNASRPSMVRNLIRHELLLNYLDPKKQNEAVQRSPLYREDHGV